MVKNGYLKFTEHGIKMETDKTNTHDEVNSRYDDLVEEVIRLRKEIQEFQTVINSYTVCPNCGYCHSSAK